MPTFEPLTALRQKLNSTTGAYESVVDQNGNDAFPAAVFTSAQAAALAAAMASTGGYVDGTTLFDPTFPNGGRGKLAVSWQINPTKAAYTGTGYEPSGGALPQVAGNLPASYPVPITTPQAIRPVVYQAYAATGQCAATAEIADDVVPTLTTYTATSAASPAAVASGAYAEQTLTCVGITDLDRVLSVTKAAQQAGLQIVAFRVTAAGVLSVTYFNSSGASITPTGTESYTVKTNLVTGGQPSIFNCLGFWAKAVARADGLPYTYGRLDMATDNAFANRMFSACMIRADNVWRFYLLPATRESGYGQYGTAGTFTIGQTRWDYIRLVEQGGATALTLTATPAIGDTSATLTGAFATTSEVYPVKFSSGEVRMVQLTNGATTATWATPLTAVATTAITYATTYLAQGSTDSVQIGPVYRDPAGKAFAYIRFDDCLADQYIARQTLSTQFVGISGVTLPVGAYSAKDVVNAFGLKASCFILTSCVGKASSFMTLAQLLDLQNAYGWSICFQTHYNPCSSNNLGLRLLGPYGYNLAANVYGSIASIAGNVVTTTNVHRIVQLTGNAGLQGFRVTLIGPTLPARTLSIGQTVWLRDVTTTTFTLHLTEADAADNTNIVTLDVGGTSWGYRAYGSSMDTSGILSDFTIGQAQMQSWGLTGWRYYASNQGATDHSVLTVLRQLKAAGSLRLYMGTQGAVGVSNSGFNARPGIGFMSGGQGFVGGGQLGVPIAPIYDLPTGFATEVSSEQTPRDYIDSLIARGAVGGNYHHFFNTEANLRALCAYCDHIKLRVNQGLLLTGNMDDLFAYLNNTGTAGSTL